jgi:hypothetical protein
MAVAHDLNSGWRRVEPASVTETGVVGHCWRLDSFTAAVVDVVEDELDELQAASMTAPAASTDSTPAFPRRRDVSPCFTSDGNVDRRVDMVMMLLSDEVVWVRCGRRSE